MFVAFLVVSSSVFAAPLQVPFLSALPPHYLQEWETWELGRLVGNEPQLPKNSRHTNRKCTFFFVSLTIFPELRASHIASAKVCCLLPGIEPDFLSLSEMFLGWESLVEQMTSGNLITEKRTLMHGFQFMN